jgi:hypothetical protein
LFGDKAAGLGACVFYFLAFGICLCVGGFVLLLCGLRLYLFLHPVLVRGFRRFVTHDPKGTVHDNWRQSGGVGFSDAAIFAS